jgi:dsRNA-specific ribonuclease
MKKKKKKKLCVSKQTYNYISFLGLSFLVITLRTKIYSHYKKLPVLLRQ